MLRNQNFTATSENAGTQLTVTPASIARGGTVTVTFNNITNPKSSNWIGIFAQGAADTAYKACFYAGSCSPTYAGAASASGSCRYTVPTSFTRGVYEFRLFDGWTRLAVSNAFTVN